MRVAGVASPLLGTIALSAVLLVVSGTPSSAE